MAGRQGFRESVSPAVASVYQFSPTLADAAGCRLFAFATISIRLRPFADFCAAITLAMSLDEVASGRFLFNPERGEFSAQ
jgi:hypothetical protein